MLKEKLNWSCKKRVNKGSGIGNKLFKNSIVIDLLLSACVMA